MEGVISDILSSLTVLSTAKKLELDEEMLKHLTFFQEQFAGKGAKFLGSSVAATNKAMLDSQAKSKKKFGTWHKNAGRFSAINPERLSASDATSLRMATTATSWPRKRKSDEGELRYDSDGSSDGTTKRMKSQCSAEDFVKQCEAMKVAELRETLKARGISFSWTQRKHQLVKMVSEAMAVEENAKRAADKDTADRLAAAAATKKENEEIKAAAKADKMRDDNEETPIASNTKQSQPLSVIDSQTLSASMDNNMNDNLKTVNNEHFSIATPSDAKQVAISRTSSAVSMPRSSLNSLTNSLNSLTSSHNSSISSHNSSISSHNSSISSLNSSTSSLNSSISSVNSSISHQSANTDAATPEPALEPIQREFVAEQQLAEQRLAEQQLAEQRLAEQQLAEQQLAEQRLAEQQLAEQRLAEQRFADQQPTKQQDQVHRPTTPPQTPPHSDTALRKNSLEGADLSANGDDAKRRKISNTPDRVVPTPVVSAAPVTPTLPVSAVSTMSKQVGAKLPPRTSIGSASKEDSPAWRQRLQEEQREREERERILAIDKGAALHKQKQQCVMQESASPSRAPKALTIDANMVANSPLTAQVSKRMSSPARINRSASRGSLLSEMSSEEKKERLKKEMEARLRRMSGVPANSKEEEILREAQNMREEARKRTALKRQEQQQQLSSSSTDTSDATATATAAVIAAPVASPYIATTAASTAPAIPRSNIMSGPSTFIKAPVAGSSNSIVKNPNSFRVVKTKLPVFKEAERNRKLMEQKEKERLESKALFQQKLKQSKTQPVNLPVPPSFSTSSSAAANASSAVVKPPIPGCTSDRPSGPSSGSAGSSCSGNSGPIAHNQENVHINANAGASANAEPASKKKSMIKTPSASLLLTSTSLPQSAPPSSNNKNNTMAPAMTAPPAGSMSPNTPWRAEDNYEISDKESSDSESELDSDDDDTPKKQVPEWARKENLITALHEQYHAPNRIDPDDIFGEIPACDLEIIFKSNKKRYKQRGSSAIWERDGLTVKEKRQYRKDLGLE